jgi:hypothetical protein
MARQTLADVGRRALEDPAFWQELRANPREALRRADYTLEEEDIRALEEAVSANRIAFDLDEFMKAAHALPPEGRWPGRWVGRWPGRWPPFGGSPRERS